MLLEAPFAAALNHLLDAEPWACERLAPFAGQVVELRAPPFPSLRLVIREDGRVRPAPAEAAPALVVSVQPHAPAALLRGEDHLLRAVAAEGDPALAQAVMALVRHLRWDAEEDLSRLFGDAIAHRLAQAGRDFAAWQADAARRLAESAADYAVQEKRLIVGRPELEAFGARVGELRDAVERLQKRVERLG